MCEIIRNVRIIVLILVTIISFVGMTVSARAELLYYDPFLIGNNPFAGEYTLGQLVGQNPKFDPYSFFTGPWQGFADDGAAVQSPGLSYLSTLTAGGSVIANQPSRPWRNLTSPWDATTNSTYYMSYVMSFGGIGLMGETRDDVGHRVVEMWSSGGPVGSDVAIVARIGYMSYNGNFNSLPPALAPLKFGLGIGTEQIILEGPASFLEDIGRTHLFVLKFTLSDQAASDRVQLFFDPTNSEEPILPNAEFVGVDITLGAVSGPVQFFGTGTGSTFDEIRFGTQFEDVLPIPVGAGACSELGEACYLTIIQSMNGIYLSPEGDLNNDGRVDLYDLRLWRDNRTDGLPQFISVPEPAGMPLPFIGMALSLSLSRRYQAICISADRKLWP